jgi:triacylglycerol lipase
VRNRRSHYLARAAATLVMTSALFGVSPPASPATAYPVNYNFFTAFGTGIAVPNTPPPGANNPSCRSSAHPYPVVLVHGTGANQNDSWQAVAPVLANNGYCVYTFTYGQTWYSGGFGGIASMYQSAGQLATFVGHVLRSTGASQVDLVGHSQGGTVERIYLQDNGGVAKVHRVVGLAGANSGVPGVSGLATVVNSIPGLSLVVALGCPACGQLSDSSTYKALSPPTYANIQYTNIVSTNDEFITPYTIAFEPAAPNVLNETVQSVCPNDNVGHIGLIYDAAVIQMLMNVLDPLHPRPVTCDVGLSI